MKRRGQRVAVDTARCRGLRVYYERQWNAARGARLASFVRVNTQSTIPEDRHLVRCHWQIVLAKYFEVACVAKRRGREEGEGGFAEREVSAWWTAWRRVIGEG
mgnify:CR=1 FL=1